MDKDFVKSKSFPEEVVNSFNVPYIYKDSCVDEYVKYVRCTRLYPRILENSFVYMMPFSNSFTQCGVLKHVWSKCQDAREIEIFDQMKRIYIENLK